jgi:hypothetical protein
LQPPVHHRRRKHGSHGVALDAATYHSRCVIEPHEVGGAPVIMSFRD